MKFNTLCIFSILIICSVSYAEEIISHELVLDHPEINKKDGFTQIIYPGASYLPEPGAPQLPLINLTFLLKPGQTATGVDIQILEQTTVHLDLPVYPVQSPYPLSYRGEVEFTNPDPSIYDNNAFYPEHHHEPVTQLLRGHSLAFIQFQPVLYNPVQKTLSIILKARITLISEESTICRSAYERFYKLLDPERFSSMNIINPEISSHYPAISYIPRNEACDYLVITSSEYTSQFDPFIQMKMHQGFRTQLITTEIIASQYSGGDLQEKIRNCIIDFYENNGTEYVLLGGDTEIIPHRGFYVAAGSTIDDDLPSDLYYGGLDRIGAGTGPDWNTDGDSYWGETSEADYLAEVLVGRISADTQSEFAAAINKQILYQSQPVETDLEKAIMVGENLNNAPLTWGGTYKDEIINGGSYNGYYTEGFPPNFNIQIQYDRSGSWSWTELRDKLNSGVNLVNHLGHSSTSYNMKFYTSYVTNTNLTSDGFNHNFYLMYSQGCYPASIDNRDSYGNYGSDCIVEEFTTIENGCVIFIGNSRYGWYNPGGTNSGSQYLDRQFFDALFGEGITTVAGMHEDSRLDGASQCNSDPWFRWAFYELIVFGDPSTWIWTDQPGTITAGHPPTVPLGISQIDISTDTAQARIALIQNGIIIGNGITEADGDLTVLLDNPVDDVSDINVYVSAHNKYQYHSLIHVVSNEPYITCTTFNIDDETGNQNGEADYGEVLLLDITLENLGNQPGNGLNATIGTIDPYAAINNAVAFVGTMAPGQETVITDAFEIAVAADIPDQHEIILTLEVTDGNRNSWQTDLSIIVNAPDLTLDGLTVEDPSGNDNGILDPGETGTMIFQILNQGHADSPQTSVDLICTEPDITILTDQLDLGFILSANSLQAGFEVEAAADIPTGSPRMFDLQVDSGNYSFQESISYAIGLIYDDFETGNLYKFAWQNDAENGWEVISDSPWEGQYCLRSGAISHNQTSELRISGNVLAEGEISFHRKVSSENNYDYLRFYIDSILQQEWCGELSWSEVSFAIDPGEHEFKWTYYKDGSVSNGSDCGWIDYIVFPAMEMPELPEADLSLEDLDFDLLPGQNQEETIILSNPGGGDLEFSITVDYQHQLISNRDWSDPDNFGYSWIDSDDPEGPEYNWRELVPAAQEITFSHNDVASDLIDLDFSFEFYGSSYNQFRVNPNGWIGFADDWDDYHNYSLPRVDAPRPAIFGFWDDLDPLQGGNVYYYQDPDSLLVWFEDVIHYPGLYQGIYDFQMIIYSSGDILFQYNSMSGDLDTATIGIQNQAGNDGLQAAYNETYVHDDLALMFKKPLNWLQVSPLSGQILPGEDQDLVIAVNTGDLPAGEYNADIILNTNDPYNQTVVIPVGLAVTEDVLNPPALVSTWISGNMLHLSWSEVSGATTYKIYHSDHPFEGFELFATVSSNSHTIPLNSSRKFYRITAEN